MTGNRTSGFVVMVDRDIPPITLTNIDRRFYTFLAAELILVETMSIST